MLHFAKDLIMSIPIPIILKNDLDLIDILSS